MGGSIGIKFNVTDFERSLGELISKLEHRGPLMRELAAAMGDAVEENFKNQGRPAWMGWSPAYAKKRAGGQILQLSGRLAASTVQESDNDSASVGTNSVYGPIHQFGGEIKRKARKQDMHFRQKKNGEVGNRFVKKSKSNFVQTAAVGAYTIKMPARPFLHLTEQGVEAMENTGLDYFRRVIDS
ncbi:phage virion morphogenesis protein [Yersinia enterocolitica]|uniref:phage virion morphogenesis protein n=1 Tax=Yersinia enterocolitica TaxID=630 RepID=UPI0021E881A3|nr:phage virion morphogenesis protein [Yersinia enterocolitica]EKN3971082.1 phage virion morphogenesis protein [Yersinia enterocolitica]UYK00415.1 phage virion morphogenesis protein [Yersinia enterocolitica]HDL8516386.1 phage virion morphogenesis protein [Yersinia enterocolitica]HDL8556176.1 phage virion morphogenesis protein [Yersinia enterocolitica]HDW8064922.1 phage virion morphogenesis protein [Yersinia enterocolitica]